MTPAAPMVAPPLQMSHEGVESSFKLCQFSANVVCFIVYFFINIQNKYPQKTEKALKKHGLNKELLFSI